MISIEVVNRPVPRLYQFDPRYPFHRRWPHFVFTGLVPEIKLPRGAIRPRRVGPACVPSHPELPLSVGRLIARTDHCGFS